MPKIVKMLPGGDEDCEIVVIECENEKLAYPYRFLAERPEVGDLVEGFGGELYEVVDAGDIHPPGAAWLPWHRGVRGKPLPISQWRVRLKKVRQAP